MKKIIFILLNVFISCFSHAQEINLSIFGSNEQESNTINSIGYQKNHSNGKSIVTEVNLMSNSLSKIGYINNKIIGNQKLDETTYLYKFELGKKIDSIHIYIGNIVDPKLIGLFNSKNDTIYLAYKEVPEFLNQTLFKLESDGFALAKLKLINIQNKHNIITASLDISTEIQRQVNSIVIKGYEKFPKGFKKNIIKSYKNTTFNQKALNNVYKDFNRIRFIKQIKYPEILFEKDSTKIYVYLEKVKSNNFDGLLGFANNAEGKIIFNGFLDLNLTNTLNSGEIFSILWKNNGDGQKSFNGALEVPYIFKSPLGIKANLNIFNQDSIFQNTKTTLNLGYYLKNNSKLFLGYQSTESSAIQNQVSSNISDYENYFATCNYEYFELNRDEILFATKANALIKIGIGNRTTETINSNQFFANINLDYNLYLNSNNIINIRSQNYYLQSNEYLINELYRFGGINSIQGFREESLQGNLFTSILTQYRYVFTKTTYIYSIIDYGYYQDKSTNNQGNLLGFGVGFGLLTKNGLFNLSYANGNSNKNDINLTNSLVNVGFKTIF
ncbi:MAG TPA: hypothetical protein VN192_06845 [Flavobacterium sp.]|nr:hypothetical protein [Flavobacterium sp.]